MTQPPDDDITRRIDPPEDEDEGEQTRAFDPFVDDTGADDTGADDTGDAATRRMEPPQAQGHEATQRLGATPGVTEGPRTERIALPQQRSVAGWLIALAIVVALGVGMAIGYSQRTGDDEGLLERSLVGPQGGVLQFEGGGEVAIPRGALPSATAISVRKVPNENRIRLGAQGDTGAKVYERGELSMYVFEPTDIRFQQPVKITIPRPDDGLALLIDTPEGLRVVGAESEGPTVTFETTTFSFEDL